jgi:hypothetical protein
MIRSEAEAAYGTEAIDECEVTIQGGDRADDVVDVWPLLPNAEDHQPVDAATSAPAEVVLAGEPEVDDDTEEPFDTESVGPVYEGGE